jgi:hypothetical protein
VRERRAGSGGEQRCEHPAAVAQRVVPHRVDALLHADQAAALDVVRDLIAREAQRVELRAAHDALLPRHQSHAQNVELSATQPVGSTFCAQGTQNVERHRQHARISTFCGHAPTIPPPTRQTRPRHTLDTLSMRS